MCMAQTHTPQGTARVTQMANGQVEVFLAFSNGTGTSFVASPGLVAEGLRKFAGLMAAAGKAEQAAAATELAAQVEATR